VTDGVQVNGTYTDTTTTIVRILHYGLDLYISLQSDDKYVNKWGGSWEGDGLFMKISTANNIMVEYKLYFNLSGVDPDIAFEMPGAFPGSGEAAAYKLPGTVVNDTTQVDSGYTAEMVIHLDQLGYTSPYANIPVLLNIFDPDGQTGTAGEDWNIGSYYKQWWGSEWGPVTRDLRLADPPSKLAIKTTDTINLDGVVDEAFWENAEYVVIGKGSHFSSGGYYAGWGDTLNEYTDRSLAKVRFAHNGTDLYIGLTSNDSSVCAWSAGWEADGLFLWMTYKGLIPVGSERMEIKAMYFNQTEGAGIQFQTSASVPTGAAEGASFEPAGTVTHTETNGPDAGYSIEVVIHTDMFGYAEGDTVMLSACVWDIDFGSIDAYDAHVSDYAPNWWGTQWADTGFEKYFLYRGVVLSDQTVGVVDNKPAAQPMNFDLEQNYPNPFNPSTTIRFNLPEEMKVKVEVFTVLGTHVATLVDGLQSAGSHSAMWNGTDSFGRFAGNGVYFYKIITPEFSQTRKMILMK
jgi:hypothetical protein